MNLAVLLCLPVFWVSLTFIAYCAVIKLKDMRDDGRLTWQIRLLAYPALTPLFVVYWGLNLILATFLFLDLPREFEFTKRCQRYIRTGSGWRKRQALWWCRTFLNPVERNGIHC